jgi:HAD superfamily hydrolase (TIGR01490 family)
MNVIAIFDIDGTLVKGQSQKLFLSYLSRNGLIPLTIYFRLLVWFLLYKMNFIQNPASMMKKAFLFLKGYNVKYINEICHDFFQKDLSKTFYKVSLEKVKYHQDLGHKLLLISNAIEPIVKEVASYLGVSDFLATTLEIVDDKYTGNILDIMYGERKLLALNNFYHAHGINDRNTWIYSDHESDLPLLRSATNPVVVNPDSKMLTIARNNNWTVLTTV